MRNTLRALTYHIGFRYQKARGRDASARRRAQSVFAEKSLIFCVTNGRSGTKALTALFQRLPHVHACHEDKPSFHLLMRWVQQNPELAQDFWLHQKLPEIARSEKPIYLDTSHLFAKGFIEPLLAIGGRPKMVFLKREPRLIAKSMLALGDIPGRSKRALKWYLTPDDPVFLRLADASRLSDYQLCYWHALETEARQDYYRKLCRTHNLGLAEAETRTLNDFTAFETLCRELEIELTNADRENLRQQIGSTINSRSAEKKASTSFPVDYEEAEAEVRQLVSPVQPVTKARSVVRNYLSTALKQI